jgi:hypothetical protein
MTRTLEPVDPNTLRIQHCHGEERVISDRMWVATFADPTEAARYVTRCILADYWPMGVRIEDVR